MTRLVTKSSGPKPVMSTEISNGSIIFVPHGGGPLPLMDDAEHRPLTAFLRQVAGQLKRPSAIILVTAHWEANPIRVSSAAQPGMLFDYAGFPAHTYQYRYPAVGSNASVHSLWVHQNFGSSKLMTHELLVATPREPYIHT